MDGLAKPLFLSRLKTSKLVRQLSDGQGVHVDLCENNPRLPSYKSPDMGDDLFHFLTGFFNSYASDANRMTRFGCSQVAKAMNKIIR